MVRAKFVVQQITLSIVDHLFTVAIAKGLNHAPFYLAAGGNGVNWLPHIYGHY